MSPNVKPVLIPVGKERIFATYHGKAKQPAVLFLHGYQSSKNDRFRFSYDLAEKLSEHNISSLRIDFRGCGDSDGTLSFENQMEDGLAALNWLAQEHGPLAIIGRSLGGAIAVKLAAQYPVKTLVLLSPVFDLKEWNHPFTVEQELRDIPMLQMHAGKDEVLFRHHYESYKKLATPQHRIELIENGDHTFSDAEVRKNLGLESLQWFINVFYGSTHSAAKRKT